MGPVLTETTIENLGDLHGVARGLIAPNHVRRIVVLDALVDTVATSLVLPTRLIRQLGLDKRYEKCSHSSVGTGMASRTTSRFRSEWLN